MLGEVSERMICQIVSCQKKIHPDTESYAMMCKPHWILWLQDKVMLEDHPEECPCEVC